MEGEFWGDWRLTQEVRVMVDSIKGRAQTSARPNSNSLRDSFKSLSSGTKIPERVDSSKSGSTTEVAAAPEQVNHVVRNLNDAVSFSRLALKSIEQITQNANASGENPVQNFAKDLEKLRSHINDVVGELEGKADTAEVLHANLSSADVKLQDVETAQTHATKTGAQIHFDEEQALGAHGGLAPENVAHLLRD